MHEVTTTPEFVDWFADSKIVDAEGKPRVVYHGSRVTFEGFKSPKRDPDIGFHFGDISQAEYFAGFNAHGRTATGGRIMPVYLRISNPLRVVDVFGGKRRHLLAVAWHLCDIGIIDVATRDRAQNQGSARLGWSIIIKALKARGRDGFIYKNVREGNVKGENSAYVVFDAEQIRSVFEGA